MTSIDNPVGAHVEVESIGSTARVLVRGEADADDLERLVAALARLVQDDRSAVVIDLSELRFIDVPALRLLASHARRLRQSGREVSTVGARPVLRRAARLLDPQGELGLR